ncbi:hypothetical protein SAMD00019534_082160 [Acytostelium subglobosum LB1]|uniref:hypothetical protein n=1 Tax=Acytostelium subglobosum LB1 TaxID=1410327 RepID=UPI0006451DD8|nr:hypothetical protein SAMD00019534_082160 [Acytostelium subglobosum LB1]GAM25041.1 hypothetical protein SAMD00019534_082160 [Acytostelium subglobosum LB1]|eukprot:XP_012752130.1 hypothetical protein SAMD00019534_082160 [Acytostelium subglobosum LB1]
MDRLDYPITVIFSRPVIALGTETFDNNVTNSYLHLFCNSEQPVAGHFRWVTSSIVRFEVLDGWPNNLRCSFYVDPLLVTYDGVRLDKIPDPIEFETQPLHMAIYDVHSPKTDQMTNNWWDPFRSSKITDSYFDEQPDIEELTTKMGMFKTSVKMMWSWLKSYIWSLFDDTDTSGGRQNFIPEVPPDAIVQVVLSCPVQLDTLKTNLKAFDSNGASIQFNIFMCNDTMINRPGFRRNPDVNSYGRAGHSFCIAFGNRLAVGQKYKLVLPKNTVLHPSTGPTHSSTSVELMGLHPFQIRSYTNIIRLNSNTLVLSIPHGLPHGPFTPEQLINVLKESMSISPSLDFNISIQGSTQILVEALFEPDSVYELMIKPVQPMFDGWDLPLMDHNVLIKVDAGSSYVTTHHSQSLILLPAYNQSQLSAISQNRLDKNTKFKMCRMSYNTEYNESEMALFGYPVTMSNLLAALRSISKYKVLPSLGSPLENVTLPQIQDNLPKVTELNSTLLWQESGAYVMAEPTIYDYACKGKRQIKLVQESDVGVTLLSFGPNKVVWVTNVTKGDNMADLTVHLYTSVDGIKRRHDRTISQKVNYHSQGKTDARGVVHFSVDSSVYAIAVEYVSKHDGKSRLFVHLAEYRGRYYDQDWHEYSKPSSPKYQIVTDRGFYKPGDTIHLKAYIKYPITISQEQQRLKTHTVEIGWTTSDGFNMFKQDVLLDPVYNSFNVSLAVPSDVRPDRYTLNVNSYAPETDPQQPDVVGDSPLPSADGGDDDDDDEEDDGSLFNNREWRESESGGGTHIIVSDPRVPTGIVTLTSDDEFILASKNDDEPHILNLKVKTSNYLGLVQPGQIVTVTYSTGADWFGRKKESANKTCRDNERCRRPRYVRVHKEFNITTDDNGMALVPISLDANEFYIGNQVRVVAKYMDPSRSLIKSDEFERYILDGPYQFKFELASYINNNPKWMIDVPGIPQGIIAHLYHVPTMSKINNVNVSLTMNDSHICSFMTNTDMVTPPCHFAIPDSTHDVVAQAVDPLGNTVTGSFNVYNNQDEYEKEPFGFPKTLTLYPDRQFYDDIDIATQSPAITFWNPFTYGNVLVNWGCNNFQDIITKSELSYGIHSFTLPSIPEVCLNTGLYVTLAVQGSEPGFVVPSTVPQKSIPKDTPRASTGTKYLRIIQRPRINLAIELPTQEVQPRSKVNITLKVTGANGLPHQGETEACLFVVDKRVLDLVPHPQTSADSFRWSMKSYSLNGDTSRNNIIDNYMTMFNTVLHRLQQKRWMNQEWDLGSVWRDSDLNEKAMSTKSRGQRMGIDDDGFSSSDNAHGDMRSKFQTTPLYLGKTIIKDGQTVVTLELPDDLTTFEIRAIAATQMPKLELATAHSSIISKKDYNILPIHPRFARIGDRFECGVSIVLTPEAQSSSKNLIVSIQLALPTHLQMLTDQSIIEVSSSNQAMFTLEALHKGHSRIIFVLADASNPDVHLDSVSVDLDVLGRQLPVHISTSMSISASDGEHTESIIMPPAEPGTGTLDVVVAKGHYPMVEINCVQMIERATAYGHSFADLIALQAANQALTLYGYNNELINLTRQHLDRFNASLYLENKPVKYINNESMYKKQAIAQRYMLVLVLNRLSLIHEGIIITPEIGKAMWLYIDKYLEDAVEHIDSKGITTSLKADIAFASLAAGGDWEHSSDYYNHKYGWTALARSVTHRCDLLCQTLYVVSWSFNHHEDLANPPPFVQKVLKNIDHNTRVQGSTAYVHSGRGSSANMLLTTYSIIAIIQTLHQSPVLDKLVTYMATGGDHPGFEHYYIGYQSSTEQLAVSTLLLAHFDKPLLKMSNSSEITLKLFKDRQTSNELMSAHFKPNLLGSVSSSIDFGQFGNNGTQLHFLATGEGQLTASVGITFVPAELPASPVYHGFLVHKTIRQLDSNQSLTLAQLNNTIAIGQMVEVVISITTPDDMGGVDIEDSVSAGIEPMDNNIYDSDYFNNNHHRYELKDWFSAFSEQSVHKTQVNFHGYHIGEGCYTVSYRAIATTRGTFTLPPAKVSSTSRPDVFGLSEGIIFTIQ